MDMNLVKTWHYSWMLRTGEYPSVADAGEIPDSGGLTWADVYRELQKDERENPRADRGRSALLITLRSDLKTFKGVRVGNVVYKASDLN